MSDDLILGVDGGGTKTVAWIAPADDSQNVLGRGVSGPSNWQVVGEEAAKDHLRRAIEASRADSGLPRRQFAAACIGLAGADREADQKMIRQWAVQQRLTDRLLVVNDALPVLYAATGSGCGVALISGTGSFALGRREDGATVRVGGWGYLLGDEGSAYAIALDGLRAAAKSADGRGPATNLLESLLAALGRKRPEDLIPATYDAAMTRSRIAALCPLVFKSQQSGDSVADQIIANAANCLAQMVAAVAARLQYTPDSFPLALAGGVLLHHRELRNRLQSALRNLRVSADPVVAIPEPVRGALVMSQRAASRAVS